MKIAYADPPYIGQAKRYPERLEVDHQELISHLCRDYDSWALSCSSPSLKQILSYCPSDIRIAAWVKPFNAFKKGVYPAYAWEPVIFWHPRRKIIPDTEYKKGKLATPKDWVAVNMTLEKGLCGAKPPRFCFWLFDLLGAEPTDIFFDLYPGTGIVMRCWEQFYLKEKPSQLILETQHPEETLG